MRQKGRGTTKGCEEGRGTTKYTKYTKKGQIDGKGEIVILFADESYRIMGACFEVYKEQGMLDFWKRFIKSAWRSNSRPSWNSVHTSG